MWRSLSVLVLACLLPGIAAGQTPPPPDTSAGSETSAAPERHAWELKPGIAVRVRYERYENDAWGEGPDDDHDYIWTRAIPRLDVSHESGFRFFAELISAFESGDEAGRSPVDENSADIQQAHVDFKFPVGEQRAVTLRGGRQILALGSERLISARYGPNVPRSFDAATAVVETVDWKVDLLCGRPVENEIGAFDDDADGSRSVWTAYATRTIGKSKGVDLYYIGIASEMSEFNQGAGREDRHTIGSRIFGHEGPWDWNFELMGQAGRFAGGDIRAWSIASDTGYVLEDLPLDPRVGLRANVISGDDDPGDRDLETFNPLFPKGKYFGEAGLLGPYNLLNLHPSVELALSDKWQLGLASVLYWRESTGDGIYDTAGHLLRPDGGTRSRFIGSQFDAVLDYAPSTWLDLSVGGSVFVPGSFIEHTGSDETVQFVGCELALRF